MNLSQYHEIKACRLCGFMGLEIILNLPATPPANNLVTCEQVSEVFETIPLEVCQCPKCKHVQLKHVVDPGLLFSNYLYTSRTSAVMQTHLRQQAVSITKRHSQKANRFVVEFGSNDGSLLKVFQEYGYEVLGVDPAENIVAEANANGIPTIAEFFNKDTALEILKKYPKPGVICANHCFAHIEDLHSVMEGVKILLHQDGEFIFEVGYLADVYSKGLFDTIYHEHLDYHHVTPLVDFFKSHGMTLVHVERHDIQGGALRGFVRLGEVVPGESIHKLILLEEALGLNRAVSYKSFSDSIHNLSRDLLALLNSIREGGCKVYGFGVPAKATTLLYSFGITKELVPVIVDDNPLKQGRFIPNIGIPILAREAIYQHNPEYVLIFAWNFADAIIEDNKAYLDKGGKFIVPLPNLKVMDRAGIVKGTP